MSLTVGNTQKLASIAVKHAWCHGLLASTPESAPFDVWVGEAAVEQLLIAGLPPIKVAKPWSSMNLEEYRLVWKLLSSAAAVCGMSVAEWELRAFQPGKGASPVRFDVPLASLASEQARFLTTNSFAAEPGASLLDISRCAGEDARHAAYLMGARPYNMSRSEIHQRFPGQFEEFKADSQNEAWGVADLLITGKLANARPAIEGEMTQIVTRLRATYAFV